MWIPSGDRVGFEDEAPQDGNLRVSRIYYDTIECGAKVIIHQGGESSGKTVNVLPTLATRAATMKDIVITVTAPSLPHLKVGALRDFQMYTEPYFKDSIEVFNKTHLTYRFKSGSIIEFKSFENEIVARGPRRHWLYVNEANGLPERTFFQLNNRTKYQTIIDYNPSAKFWAHDMHHKTDTQLFISNHWYNPFLSDFDHKRIESIEDNELWRVYARGLTGNISGVIYPNWTLITNEDFDRVLEETGAPIFGGLDFGYSVSPTAGVKMFRVGNNLYVKELCYEPELPPEAINAIFCSNGFTKEDIVVADSADPSMGAQLRKIPGTTWVPASKPPGSINAGILMLKQCNVFYAGKDIKYEIERYIWEVDKKTGKSTDTPIDDFNHLCDAIRYGYYYRFFRPKS